MKTNRKLIIQSAQHLAVKLKVLLAILLVVLAVSVFAQSGKLETEKGLREAVAPFDTDVRANILVASEYPNVLTQLRNSQTQTAESFQKVISHFRQKKQEWFYTISRYPELMHQLATLPSKQTEADVYKLLPHQDPDLQEAAWRLYKSEKKNLAKLDNIRMNASREFEKSISNLGGQARSAFNQIQNKPDVLTLLTNNIELTAQLGAAYKSNPAGVKNELAVLHDKLEIQNERDAAAFKKQLESDPKAMRELRQAQNAYSGNPYYSNPYYYPYSYWFGYPYWYSYPMWYPGMFWYTPGFYFGLGGLYGFPSFGFSYWFYNGGYYMRYPHLYRQFGLYYRNNVTVARGTMFSTNRGFMNVASSHYHPFGARVNTSSPYTMRSNFVRPNTMNGGFRGNTGFGAQSRGGFGGRSSMGMGGGFHGGGFHGGHR